MLHVLLFVFVEVSYYILCVSRVFCLCVTAYCLRSKCLLIAIYLYACLLALSYAVVFMSSLGCHVICNVCVVYNLLLIIL